MSYKTVRRLSTIADLLEKSLRFIAGAIELIIIDLAWGKSWYRKKYPRIRPVIQRTVIYRQGAPRVVYVERAKQ